MLVSVYIRIIIVGTNGDFWFAYLMVIAAYFNKIQNEFPIEANIFFFLKRVKHLVD